jgi:hypothetical protein
MGSTIPAASRRPVLLEAVLEGGPMDIPPSERLCTVDAANRKMKLSHRGGCERFERNSEDIGGDGALRHIYRWVMRTWIAE